MRDCYEAYAVYTFIALLIAILVDGQGLPHLITKVLYRSLKQLTKLFVCMQCLGQVCGQLSSQMFNIYIIDERILNVALS